MALGFLLRGPGIKSVTVKGRDPLVESARIRYGAVAALPATAVAVVAAQIHYLGTQGQVEQNISTDLRTAYHNHSIISAHFMVSIAPKDNC